ncbi:hypothetical protein [Microbulbifer epialgicus]|uniref:Uncharacterized protein n=1 Tax=Microbulbifer epialgicus TaxID=393907 RepID=A0ABV4P1G7_9GAMM
MLAERVDNPVGTDLSGLAKTQGVPFSAIGWGFIGEVKRLGNSNPESMHFTSKRVNCPGKITKDYQ